MKAFIILDFAVELLREFLKK